MEFKGKISSAFRDIVTGKWNLTFSTDQNVAEAAQIFSGKDIDVKLKRHKEKRSLDANAYYWCLLTKLATRGRNGSGQLSRLYEQQEKERVISFRL